MAAPTLNITDVTTTEGAAPGTKVVTFTVTLTGPAPAGGVTFDIATADWTAQDGNPAQEQADYIPRALTGQVIPEGSSGPFQFSVTVYGDSLVEPDETFLVNVTNISGALAGDTQGIGTIQDDDASPSQPTALRAGDLAVIQINSDDPGGVSADTISFVLLKPITSGTAIHFTDRTWTPTLGNNNVNAGSFSVSGTDGTFTYTAGADLPAGSIINITTAQLTAAGINISDAGEAIYVYQGAANAPTSFLYAIEVGDGSTALTASIANTGLIAGVHTAALAGDNTTYGDRGHNIQISDLLSRIGNAQNWSFNDNSPHEPITGNFFSAPDQMVFAAHPGPGGITRFSRDGANSATQQVTAFENPATPTTHFYHPNDIVFDTVHGLFFVADSDQGNRRILQGNIADLMNPGTNPTLIVIYQDNDPTTAGGQFNGIAIDVEHSASGGALYFVNKNNMLRVTYDHDGTTTPNQTPVILASLPAGTFANEIALDIASNRAWILSTGSDTGAVAVAPGTPGAMYDPNAEPGMEYYIITTVPANNEIWQVSGLDRTDTGTGGTTLARIDLAPGVAGGSATGAHDEIGGYDLPTSSGILSSIDFHAATNTLYFTTQQHSGGTTGTGGVYTWNAGTGAVTNTFAETSATDYAFEYIDVDPVSGRIYISNVAFSGPGDPNGTSVNDSSVFIGQVGSSSFTKFADAGNINGSAPQGLITMNAPTITSTAAANLGVTEASNAPNSGFTMSVGPIATIDATDGDSAGLVDQLAGAQMRISANYLSGAGHQDQLTINGNTSGTLAYGTKTITFSWDATHGVMTLTGPATFDNYENALSLIRFSTSGDNITDYGNAQSRTLSWSVFDGALYSDEVSATVNVTAINDAPVNTVGGAMTFAEDTTGNGGSAPPVNAITGISVFDVDANPASQYIVAALSVEHGTLTVRTDVPGGVVAANIIGNGTTSVQLFGTQNEINATLAAVNGSSQANGLIYTPVANFNGAHALTIMTRDGGFNGNDPGNSGTGTDERDSDTKILNISNVNDAPTVVVGSQSATTILEDTPSTSGQTVSELFGSSFSDALDQQQTSGNPTGSVANSLAGIAVVGNNSHAGAGQWQYHNGTTWVDIGAASAASAQLIKADTPIRFNPVANFNGNAPTLSVRLVDSSGAAFGNGDDANLSAVGSYGGTTRYSNGFVTLSQAITAVNDAPVLGAPSSPEITYTEGAGPLALMLGMNWSDVELPNQTSTLAGGSITITVSGTGNNLQLPDGGGFTRVGSVLNFMGQFFGDISSTDSSITVSNFASTVSKAYLDILTDNFTYQATGENPNTTDRIVTMTINDGGTAGEGGPKSGSTTQTIHVVSVNDAPSGANNSKTIAEDGTYTFVYVPGGTNDFGFSDVDDNDFGGVEISTLPTNGKLFLNNVEISGPTFVSAVDITEGKLVFKGDLNENGTPYGSFTFKVRDNGGTTNNGVDTDPSANSFSFNVTPVNDAPTVTITPGGGATGKIGGEFLVNTTTLSNQWFPAVTSLASGGFVVSWEDESGQGGDASGRSIKAQIFDAAGAKVGGEFLVNTATDGLQLLPALTSLSSGGFVVSWTDFSGQGGDASSISVKAQIFDASGTKVGGEFLVNTATLNAQSQPALTSLATGGFVVSWMDNSGQGGDAFSYAIKAQIFDAAGAKVGGEFLVNTATWNYQESPKIASLSAGGFVVSWTDASGQGGDTSYAGIKAQIFSASGAKVGGEILVNTATLNQQSYPTITSLASGGFVVSWADTSEQGGDAFSYAVKAQIFDAAGAKVGGEFLINTTTAGSQQQPTITSLASGGFMASWIDDSGQGGDSSLNGVKAQIFDASGAKVGGEFLVNTVTQNSQGQPTITSLASGGVVVSWLDSSGQGGDASGTAIKAQMFGPAFQATEQTTLDLKGKLAIGDVDAGNGPFVVTLSVDHGVLTVTPGTTGAIVSGTATSVIITGTLAQIQELLGNGGSGTISFASTVDAPPSSATLTLTVKDDGNGSGNLIVNPGAEDGPSASNFQQVVAPQGWTAAGINYATAVDYAAGGSDDLNPADSSAIGGGASYFAGGPTGTTASTLSQIVDVSGYAAAIDQGAIEANLGAYLGGWEAQDDASSVAIRFLDANGNEIGNAQIGPVGSDERGEDSGLVARATAAGVPAGTRSIEVVISFTNPSGDYLDGYADNLSLTLSQIATKTATIVIAPVNDAPTVVGDASLEAAAILEDSPVSTASAPTVGTLFSANFADVDSSFAGAAIVGNASGSSVGQWQYLNGGTWVAIGARTDSTALALTSATKIRFEPAANYNGPAPTLSVRLIDNSVTFTNATQVDAAINGGSSRFSSAVVTLDQNVTSVNDAPTAAIAATGPATEQTALDLKGKLTIGDVDSGNGPIAVTLSVDHGSLTVAAGTTGAVVSGTGVGSSVTVTGTLAQIQALLGSGGSGTISFSSTGNSPPASAQLTLTVSDNGFSGTTGLGANLVTNGSFETQNGSNVTAQWIDESRTDYGGVFWRMSDTLHGWQKSDPAAEQFELNRAGSNPIFAAADGTAALDMEADQGENLSIFQDIGGLTAGQTLQLTFSAAQPTGGTIAATPQGLLEVYWNGVLVGTATPASTAMEQFTFAVTAAATGSGVGGANRLEFREVGASDARGTILDAVALRAATPLTATTSTTIAINSVNDAPSGANKTVTTSEDDAYTFAAADFGFTDVDGHSLSAVVIVDLPASGTLRLSGNAVSAGQSIAAADIPNLTFVPAADAFASPYASFNFKVVDSGGTSNNGQDTSAARTITINVTPDNLNPTLQLGNPSPALSYSENGPASVIAPDAQVADTDSANFDGGTLTVAFTANGEAGDQLGIRNEGSAAGQIGFSGSNVSYGGTVIGTVAGGADGADLVVTFDADATPAAVQALVRNITYRSSSEEPSTSARTVNFLVTDGDGGSAQASATVNLTAINDAPSGTGATVTIDEDTPHVFTAADFGFSDIDNDALEGVRFASAPSGGTIFYDADGSGSGAAIAITAFPSAVYTAADISDGKLSFVPATNLNGNAAASVSFTVIDDGGTANGGVNEDQSAGTVSFTINAVNDAPVLTGLAASVTVGENAVNASPRLLDAVVSLTDPEGNFNGGTLTIGGKTPADQLAEDRFGIRNQGSGPNQIGVSGTTVTFGGVAIGTVAGGTGTALVVTLNAAATAAAVDALIQNLTYANVSDEPAAARNLLVKVVDAGGLETEQTIAVSVTAEPELVAQDDFATTDEATAVSGNVLANDSDPAGTGLSVLDVNGSSDNVGKEIILASGAKLTLNADGSYSYNPAGAFTGLVSPESGAANSSATDTFSYSVGDGVSATVTVTVNGITASGEVHSGDPSDNDITGTSGDNLFMLDQPGDDTASGLGGNDGFYFGRWLSAGDQVDGGAGTGDQVGIQGFYGTVGAGASPFVLGADNLVNVETLALLSGGDTRYGGTPGVLYDYNIKTVDANVAAGGTLTVNWGRLQVGEDVIFDGSAETDGRFIVYAGKGVDMVTGGAQSDGFFFADGALSALDRINGGGGSDNQIGLRGDYGTQLVFAADTISNIQTIALLSGKDTRFGPAGPDYNYNLKIDDGNVAAGQTLTVNGAMLRPSESIAFDGSAETNGALRFFGGQGNDSFKGGAKDDFIWGGLGADKLDGGGGNDRFIYRNALESTATSRDTITGFGAGDILDLSAIDADSSTAANDAFTFLGSGAFTNSAGQLRAYQDSATGAWFIEGDTNGDGVADLVIELLGQNNHNVGATDFLF